MDITNLMRNARIAEREMHKRASAETSESWQSLLDEYGNTEEELDALFDQPWPGQQGYEEPPECEGEEG